MEYELIVIGSGPGGYVAALKAAELGMKVLIIENRDVGGTCLNRGCIPTKALLQSSKAYNEALNLDIFGITTDGVDFDLTKIHERKEHVVNELRQGIEKLFKSNKVELVSGTATIKKDMIVSINTKEGEVKVKGNKILIATGSYPTIIPIEGIDLPNVVNSDGLLNKSDKVYNKLIIIGGGVIGVEFATIYNNLGAEVTIIEGQDRILPQMDKEVSRTLAMSLKKKGINIITSALVDRIEEKDNNLICYYKLKDELKVEEGEGILLAIGRTPNTKDLFDKELEIEMDGRGIKVNDNFETSIPNIYAIGDVVKGMQLAHLASAQGINVVEYMNNLQPSINLDIIPSCIYTSPEIASVGMTQDEAKAKGIKVKVGKYPILANGKALISDDERGYIKVIVDAQTDKIIGADIICARATDMIGELAMAIVNGLTRSELQSVVRPHPTYEESITEAINSVK